MSKTRSLDFNAGSPRHSGVIGGRRDGGERNRPPRETYSTAFLMSVGKERHAFLPEPKYCNAPFSFVKSPIRNISPGDELQWSTEGELRMASAIGPIGALKDKRLSSARPDSKHCSRAGEKTQVRGRAAAFSYPRNAGADRSEVWLACRSEPFHFDRTHVSVFRRRKRFKPIRHRFAIGRRALRTWRICLTDGTRRETFGAKEARPGSRENFRTLAALKSPVEAPERSAPGMKSTRQ